MMGDEVAIKGQCLCGSVSVAATIKATDGGVCHCSMCRRWGGGPFFGIDCGDAVHMSGEDKIGVYASSEWAERGFCTQCGTHLFYRLRSGQYHLPIGLLDNVESTRLTHQIFIDEKPDYYSLANDLIAMTGEEAFAQYSDS